MNHLDEEISVEDVAQYCHFSKFHFCRMFKKETGESVYAFIKRLKMEQSAFKLKTEYHKSITHIGLDYGYSPSNYSWTFKKHHRVSPAAFRRGVDRSCVNHPFFDGKRSRLKSFQEYDQGVKIENLDNFTVIFERRIGNYLDLGANWRNFMERYRPFFNEKTLLIERSYDDPSITGTGNCLYDICMTVEEGCPLDNVTTITGGKYAVYRFDGLIEDIFSAYQGLFRVWLPQSGYEMAQRYGLDIYRSVDSENQRVVMDICIPVN